MIDYYETRSFVFVHGWTPTIFDRGRDCCYIEKWRECGKQAWAEARWINGMMASQTSIEEKTIVCSHWHASFGHAHFERSGPELGDGADFTPHYGAGIIAIDACASVSGFVNVIVLKDTLSMGGQMVFILQTKKGIEAISFIKVHCRNSEKKREMLEKLEFCKLELPFAGWSSGAIIDALSSGILLIIS